MSEPTSHPAHEHRGVSRRQVLVASGAALAGAVGGYAIGSRSSGTTIPAATSTAGDATVSVAEPSAPAAPAGGARTVAFHGVHQAGVDTPPALLQTFIGLDLAGDDRERARAVLRLVTDDAARLMAGDPGLGDPQPELAANPAGLTITLGLGPGFFERLGVGDRRPAQLVDLPAFETDALEKPWGQTDLLLQVGSDDAVTLAHATRLLLRDLSGLTVLRWQQPGFLSPSPATPGGVATRNLMGQVDGTANPRLATQEFDRIVWIDEGPDWVRDGTVLVLRRIRMHLDAWDILDRATQELVMGRRLDTGAPLGAERESDPVPFDAVDDRGLPVIAADAHIRVAHAATADEAIWRRPYNYVDTTTRGDDGSSGLGDSGLLFAAYMRDPRRSFIPMQRRIAASDAFNAWNTTIGSATYFIPSGVGPDQVLAEGLLA